MSTGPYDDLDGEPVFVVSAHGNLALRGVALAGRPERSTLGHPHFGADLVKASATARSARSCRRVRLCVSVFLSLSILRPASLGLATQRPPKLTSLQRRLPLSDLRRSSERNVSPCAFLLVRCCRTHRITPVRPQRARNTLRSIDRNVVIPFDSRSSKISEADVTWPSEFRQAGESKTLTLKLCEIARRRPSPGGVLE